MTSTPKFRTDLVRLRATLSGSLLTPEDEGYDQARSVWNGMIDRRPAYVVQPVSADDVVAGLRFAREMNLPISIRGGGHNIAGMAVCDGGVMIDFSRMHRVTVQPDTRRVVVQPGAVWADVDEVTQPHGLAVPSGIISSTGVAGLTLGGGFGWTTRAWGHTSDHLRSVEIVTADGEIRRASEDEHADLFWAIRGGGGNFGIVTEFEFEARQLGPEVAGGLVLHSMADAPDVIRFFREFTETAPDEVTALLVLRIAPPAPFLPEAVHGKPVAGIAAMYAGDPEDGMRALAPVKEFGNPLADAITQKAYTAHQSFLDSGQPHGRRYYWKSEYVPAIAPELGNAMISHCSRFPTPFSSMLAMHLGGATTRTSPDAGAVSHRDAGYVVAIQAAWENPADDSANISWARQFHADLRPWSSGGTYVNFLTEEEHGARIQQAYEPEIYQKLARIKATYDPENIFRQNKNIQPAQ
jgi:FAD/FMN-containing dehydrogenase